MAHFRYVAVDANAMPTTGLIDAASMQAAEDELTKLGFSQIELSDPTRRIHAKVNAQDLSIFCRQMSLTLYSDIPLLEGVKMMRDQMDNPTLKKALTKVYDDMAQAYSLSQSMRRHPKAFPRYLLNMVDLGEGSGTLETVFSQLSEYYEKEYRTQRKLRSAVAYPAILTVLMLGVVALLVLYVLPMFDEILGSLGSEIPTLTRMLMNFGQGLAIAVPGIAVLCIVGYIVWLMVRETPSGALFFDRLKVRLPLMRGIYLRTITVRFARSLSLLLKSGIQIVNALQAVDALVDNVYIEKRFNELREGVRAGMTLTDTLEQLRLFPTLFIRLASTGESTGNLDTAMAKAAEIYEDELEDRLDKLTTLIEPLLIIVLAIIVGIILISVMLPMISIMNSIG